MRADRMIRSAIAANEAHAVYAEAQARLVTVASDLTAAGRPLLARVYRHQAWIAQRAARAELLDPEPRR
jgi:DNA polymerase III psi subunit